MTTDTAAAFVPDEANARAFRTALGAFATGVTVITTEGPEGPLGLTVNSFASLSMTPPLVLWSLANSSRRYPHFSKARHYAIHVLAQDQAALTGRFGSDGAGFAGLDTRTNDEGITVLPGALARFDCARRAVHDGGDHLIIVGRVLRVTTQAGRPLIFSQGRFGGFAA
jgi:flavin reductase (DIM6/NTAB) family NADH-FMN oxidoreductase RutF